MQPEVAQSQDPPALHEIPPSSPGLVSAKPSTPKLGSQGRPPNSQRSNGTESRRSKPVFTSSLSFPEAVPTPFFTPGDTELNRSQRRSKVEAISKLDRAGLPIPTTSGPTATSFLPASATPQPTAGPSGPSPLRNPLLRPPVVNPPFDSKTVRTDAPRHVPSRSGSRQFGLEECPVFYPTSEEFLDPMAYIDSIGTSAKPYGICKVVPPEGWRMPFSLETETFRFRTRLQRLNSLEAASRAKINFLEQLSMYHLQRDDSKVTIPKINRRPVDLWTLRKEVNKLGGHLEVDRILGWPTIAELMGYDAFYATELRDAYITIVHPFDTFALRARSVSGSPLTPMASTVGSKAVPPGFVNQSPSSPTRQKSRMSAAGPPNVRTFPASAPLPPRPGPPTTPPSSSQAWTSAPPGLPPIKIQVPGFTSRDGSESELSEEETPVKRGVTPIPEYQKGEVCEVCRRGDGADKILLCDGCDRGFHTYCLDPPLSSVPANEEWFCTPCVLSQGDKYGFGDGEEHSIPSFQARDAAFSNSWFNTRWDGPVRRRTDSGSSTTHSSLSPSPTALPSRRFGRAVVSEEDVEREFWRLTESHTDTVEIEYGADIHSTTHGSASPSTETHPRNKYSRDGWNLNNMPIMPDSLLRYIKSDISGMTVPWIYVGMLFSTFCWHNEDHYTYSVNYMHWGETKTWYGIPGCDADKFEAAIKSEAPELFEQQPSLLYQLVTMMNPGKVLEAGVRVVACDQRPNEFVITFPKAYHCGFNHGINLNEAVNFALPDWLPDGKECVTRYKQHAKPPVFSHNELLITITLFSDTIRTALWLQDSLAQMVNEETTRREILRTTIPLLTETLVEEDTTEEQYQCCHCKGFCYLSQVTCKCTKLVTCLDHANQLCGCAPEKRTLRMRYSEAQLEEILAAVQARAALPGVWRARYHALLNDSPRPPLKSMRALLADGERIQYPLRELLDLRAMVEAANGWVDRTIAMTTRKTTGRRRKGRQATEDEDDGRTPEAISRLLKEVNRLAFDSPEIIQLRQIQLSINSFKHEAAMILSTPESELDREKCQTALVLGEGIGFELPEVQKIKTLVNRLEWIYKVGWEVDDREIQYPEVVELLEEAKECEIPPDNEFLVDLRRLESKGKAWKMSAERLLSSRSIELADIDALVDGQELTPTVLDLMLQLEGIRKTALNWQASARQQLEGQGSATAAQRLCKAVKGASGAQGKVHIPEIAQIQGELDFQASWLKGIAEVLKVTPKQVSSTLETVQTALQQQLQLDDERPNDQHSCFCRTPPLDPMIKCSVCRGLYHPKCVHVSVKNIGNPFKCAMCEGQPYDDRPSMHNLACFEDRTHWNFIFPTPEMDTITEIVNIAISFARTVQPYLDPLGVAVACRDVELLAHFARKLYSLPISFDTYNPKTNQRIVFEDWLYKRIHDARNPAKARTRPRRPRLQLKAANEGKFSCICSSPPADELVRVTCHRCAQEYHATCVFAPEDAIGPESKAWRCPCCTVKEGKHYHKGAEVRVQMTDRMGSDVYIDYRSTINSFSTIALEYTLPPSRVPCVLLECTKFIEPVLPEDYEASAGVPNGDEADDAAAEPQKKKRKVKAVVAKSTVPLSNGDRQPTTATMYDSGQAPRTPPRPQTALPAAPSLPGLTGSPRQPVPTPTSRPHPPTPRSILDTQPSHRAQNHPFGSPTMHNLSPNRSTFGLGIGSRPQAPAVTGFGSTLISGPGIDRQSVFLDRLGAVTSNGTPRDHPGTSNEAPRDPVHSTLADAVSSSLDSAHQPTNGQ